MNIKHNYFPNLLLNTKRFVFMAGETPSGADADMSMSPAPEPQQSEEVKKPEVMKDFKITDLALDEVSLDNQLAEDHFAETINDIQTYANESRKAIEEYKKDENADQKWATAQLAEIDNAENSAKMDYQYKWDVYNKQLAEKRHEALGATTQKLLQEAGDKTLSEASARSTLSEFKKTDPDWYEANRENLIQRVSEISEAQKAAQVDDETLATIAKVSKDIKDGGTSFPDIIGSRNLASNRYFDQEETTDVARGLALAIYDNEGKDGYRAYIGRSEVSVKSGSWVSEGNINLQKFIDAAVPVKEVTNLAQEHATLLKQLVKTIDGQPSMHTDANIGYAYGTMIAAEKVFAEDPEGLASYKAYFDKTVAKVGKDKTYLKHHLVTPQSYKDNLSKAINELRPANLTENTEKNATFLTDLGTKIDAAKELWKNGSDGLGLSGLKLTILDDAQMRTYSMLSTLPSLGSIDLSTSAVGIELSRDVSDLEIKILSALKVKVLEIKEVANKEIQASPSIIWYENAEKDPSVFANLSEADQANITGKLEAFKTARLNLNDFTFPSTGNPTADQLKALPHAITQAQSALKELEKAIQDLPITPATPVKSKKKRSSTPRTESPAEDEPVASATAPTSAPAQTAPETPAPETPAKAEPSTATKAAETAKAPEAPVKEARFVGSKEDVRSAERDARDADGSVSSVEQAPQTAKTSTEKDMSNAVAPETDAEAKATTKPEAKVSDSKRDKNGRAGANRYAGL